MYAKEISKEGACYWGIQNQVDTKTVLFGWCINRKMNYANAKSMNIAKNVFDKLTKWFVFTACQPFASYLNSDNILIYETF